MLDFSLEQILQAYQYYNLLISPLQLLFIIAGFAGVYLAISSSKYSDRILSGILTFFWLWNGIFFFIIIASDLTPYAYVVGGLFITMAALLFYYGPLKNELFFGYDGSFYNYLSFIIIFYAMIAYPFLSWMLGKQFEQVPTFGLPGSFTIFTIAIFLLAKKTFPLFFLIVPIIYGTVAFFLAYGLGLLESYGTVACVSLGSMLIIIRYFQLKKAEKVYPNEADQM